MVKSVITLSGSSFYRKIIRKYQVGKMNSLRFPVMIFCKNVEHLLPQRTSMSVLVQFHLHDLNTISISSLIAKGVQATKELFRAEKRIPRLIQKPGILKNPQVILTQYKTTPGTLPKGDVFVKMIHFVSFLKSIFSQSGNMRSALNNVPQPSYLAAKAAMPERVNYYLLLHGDYMQIKNPRTWNAIDSIKRRSSVIQSQSNISLNNAPLSTSFYSQTYYDTALRDGTATHQLLNYGNYIQNANSQIKSDYYSGFETKSPVVLSHVDLLLNNTLVNASFHYQDLFKKTYQNQVAFIKPVIKISNYGTTGFIPLYKSNELKDNDNFYFQNTLKMEQKIERVGKIAEEAKEAVKKISIPAYSEMDVKRQVDFTRLSDQVYQDIERKIRIERERRGI